MTKGLQIINAYIEEYPLYHEFIKILKDVFILRQESASKHKENIFPLDEKTAEQKLSAGNSLVNMNQDAFSPFLPQQYFLELLTMRNPGSAEDIKRKLLAGELDYEELIRKSFTIPKAACIAVEEDDEAFDLLDFLLKESMHPFFALLTQEYKALIAGSKWSKGRCPVCGQEASLSFLKTEEEGKRYLFCAQCALEWAVNRIQCPFCDNEKQQKLGFFTIGNDEKYRVYICHQCKKYIKTIDTRKVPGQMDLEVENLITLHLDILARKEGYF